MLAAADDWALDFVREARFAPKPGRGSVAEYTSGNVVFDWHTQAPTNAPTPIPLSFP